MVKGEPLSLMHKEKKSSSKMWKNNQSKVMSDVCYVIGKVDKRCEGETHSSVWPKLLAYSFDKRKILITEGCGHGLMGASFEVSTFDVDQWKDIFDKTDLSWFGKSILDGSLLKIQIMDEFYDFLEINNCSIEKISF